MIHGWLNHLTRHTAGVIGKLAVGDVESPADIASRVNRQPPVDQNGTRFAGRLLDGNHTPPILVPSREVKEQIGDPVNTDRLEGRGGLGSDPDQPRRRNHPPAEADGRSSAQARVGSISKRH